MKSKLFNVFMFAVGAAVGSAVTWKIVKDRYERIAQEEIESVKEAFSSVNNDQTTDDCESEGVETPEEDYAQINWEELEDLNEEEEENADEPDQNDYAKLVNTYTNKKGGAETVEKPRPYVISPYDFGEIDSYHQIELTYYADGTVEDEEYNIIPESEVDDLIGQTSLYTFGEYEDDAVFVRNEYLCTDFQILKDYRTYAEARSIGPGQVNDE